MTVQVRSARGGHGSALSELKLYQRSAGVGMPQGADLVVVAIDANCSPWAQARNEIEESIGTALRPRAAIACPEPHIERWYLADPDSVFTVVGARPNPGRRKCDRNRYKKLLADTVKAGGHPTPLGGIEFASELVLAMDLYRAGKAERSLKDFVDRVRDLLRAD
ncbi:MAG: hypothetical protein AB1625_10405 [Acidobacteriota bacterium]